MTIHKLLMMEWIYFRLWAEERLNFSLSTMVMVAIIITAFVAVPSFLFYYLFSFLMIQPFMLYIIDAPLKKNRFFEVYDINGLWQEILKVSFIYSILTIYILIVSFFREINLAFMFTIIFNSFLFAIMLFQIKSTIKKIPLLFLWNVLLVLIFRLIQFWSLVIGLILTIFLIRKIYDERYYQT